ncbi:putative toxin-antitoxin system toxin component, PIN family [bacterium]|nr:putative toxin-antitoxin system toxin component, PIN family [bacterium]
MKVIIDTNVLVSALLGGHARSIIDLWMQDRFQLVVSSAILGEYIEVIARPKFKLPPYVIDDITRYLFRNAILVTPIITLKSGSVDPKDDPFLEAAIAGQVDVIISGDHHLLDIESFDGIPIITVRTFLDNFTGFSY